jgi:hypothetical protein
MEEQAKPLRAAGARCRRMRAVFPIVFGPAVSGVSKMKLGRGSPRCVAGHTAQLLCCEAETQERSWIGWRLPCVDGAAFRC